MSDKSSAFAAVLVEHKADNVHVAINPDEGFLMSFECGISEAAQIFEKLKLAALR